MTSPHNSEGREPEIYVAAELRDAFEQATDLELGLTFGDIKLDFDDPRLIAEVTGSVAFERRGHGLRMIVDARLEPNPPATLHVRHSFRAVLRADDDGLVLDSLTLGAPEWTREGWDEPDRGVSSAVLDAVRPAAIIAKIVHAIHERGDHFQRLAERLAHRNEERWMLLGAKGERLAKVASRIEDTPGRPRRRGPGRVSSDEVYRQVAVLCVAAFNDGQRNGFHRRIAEQFEVPPKTATDWIYKARRDGWLAPSAPGRTYFAPGPRLIEEEGDSNG